MSIIEEEIRINKKGGQVKQDGNSKTPGTYLSTMGTRELR